MCFVVLIPEKVLLYSLNLFHRLKFAAYSNIYQKKKNSLSKCKDIVRFGLLNKIAKQKKSDEY